MSHRTNTRPGFGYLRRYPVDLATVSLAAILAYVVVTSFGQGSTLRLFATLPLALFFPGYALVSLLFPARERDARETTATEMDARPRGIDVAERLGLSFVLSLSVVPLIAIALPFTRWGLHASSVAAALVVVTVVLAQIGVVRRLRTPEAERFSVSLSSLGRLRSEETGTIRVSSVLLVLAIGLAVGALLLAFLVPASAGGFTELGLYSENEDGELVAGEIPDEVGVNESIPVTISVENHEDTHNNYTIVVQEQHLEDGEVVDRTELRRIDASISEGSSGTGERELTPTAAEGETVRISLLLFEDDPPATPTNENADEDTFFWVTVTDDA